MAERKLTEKYTILADNVPATVRIWDVEEENVPIYELEVPIVGPATEALLSELKDKLTEHVPLEIENVTDPKKFETIKKKFLVEIRKIIKENLPNSTDKEIDIYAGIMLHRMYGLGFVEIMMADDLLEELAVNGSEQPISIYHKKYGWCKTTEKIASEEEVFNLSSQIGRKVNREINSLNPIMDAHLLSGDRVAATLFPISTGGNTITIRRFSRNPWTIIHLISPEYKTLSVEIAALLWQAIHYEMNVLVAGGTASGKTSILNAICSLMPPTQRIISIEDTREIALPEALHWNWVPLTTRNQNPEGQGEVTMLDLMVSSLRMRPDRIIVGEVRRKAQAETMFEAMHTGHSVYTTLHADTIEQVKRRLLEPPIQIPPTEVEALHLALVQFRDRRKGTRRTLEVAEILSSSKGRLEANYLYRWHPRDDSFEKGNDSIRIVEELNLRTGMTRQEILKDLKERQNILEWMLKFNLKDIHDVGNVMRLYYKNKKTLMGFVTKNQKPEF
jgi:archaeal flagellar protein FlaI